jgi:tetratricopeptide (TPR) repeat protein
MARLKSWPILFCITAMLAGGAALAADDDAQADLDKAFEVKLKSESVADLNQVIDLCQQALKEGLDESGAKLANELLASTLTQRAEMICLELFERPVSPNRGRRLAQLALSDLEETLKLDAEQLQAQLMIGRLYAQLGETEKGLQALDAAVRLSADEPPTKAKALMLRANLKKDPQQRKADYDEAVKTVPRDANVLRLRGMFYLTQNDSAAAIADLDAAILLDPKDADTYEARGIALSMGQRYDEALECFTKTIELAPDSPAAFTHRARIRAIKGDLPAALHDVEEALKIQPGAIQALLLHAMLLGSAGKYEQALADMDLLRQAMPDSVEVMVQMATLYQASKQPQKAVATYDSLLEADPSNAAAFRGRADAYLSLGKQAEAIVDYEQALKIEPKNSGVLNNLAWVLATSPEQDLRDGSRAIELAKLACEATEYKQAHILSTLAAGYAEAGDFETAVNWSKKAVEIGGDRLKDQLKKELQSYEARQPWREAVPPNDDLEVEADPESDRTAEADKTPAPTSADTAGRKRRN